MAKNKEPEDTEWTDWFKSEASQARVREAEQQTYDKLAAAGQSDVLACISDAIGTLYGVARVFKVLGMKHTGTKVIHEVFLWLKKGT